MGILQFTILIICAIILGALVGVIAEIIARKKSKNSPKIFWDTELFCDTNYVLGKFTDQDEIAIDEITEIKLLDI